MLLQSEERGSQVRKKEIKDRGQYGMRDLGPYRPRNDSVIPCAAGCCTRRGCICSSCPLLHFPFLSSCCIHTPLVLVNYPCNAIHTISSPEFRETFGRKECVQLWSIKLGVGLCREERSLIILIKTGRGRAFTPRNLHCPALFVQGERILGACPQIGRVQRGSHEGLLRDELPCKISAFIIHSIGRTARNQAFIRVSPQPLMLAVPF